MISFKTFIAAAVVAVAPIAASAVTVDVDIREGATTFFGGSDTPLTVGEPLEFRFTAEQPITILNDISLTAVDGVSGQAVAAFSYSLNSPADSMSDMFGGVMMFGTTGVGRGSIDGGFSVAAGETFSIFFAANDAIANGVVTGSFNTAIGNTVIPVPAAGFLLGGMMLAGAVAARRKAKKADV